eukprot:CAMPEP_0197944584 /NCGR_PEP_ID=MMETSP1439-20131203/125479_1 /TAXON_ID=66791 /ORGANISM="Gonyaulax spinifera, Strain CCMP409" /LENGTH=301 /DNA_ID=CAMNT_0043567837 /DNA_START=71 /DNA_END=978 /DNA_ORIENTATION=-
MALEAHLQQAVLLKKVVDAMKDLCKDVNFDCSEKGLQVQSMDSSHVALVSLLLRESAFSEFKCDRPTSLGMNVDSLAKILKMCGPSDPLKLGGEPPVFSASHLAAMALEAHLQQAVLLKKVVDAMKDLCKDVNFDCSEKGLQVQSMDSSHVALVSLLLRESAFSEFKCDRPTSLGMNVDSLAKILKMCGPSDSLKLRWRADADTVSFQCESGEEDGDVGAGNVMLKPRESEKPEEKVTLTVHEPVTATFALRYLVNFAKAAPLCGAVELGLGPDAPLLVKYDLERTDNGFMQFYLAPKIDE